MTNQVKPLKSVTHVLLMLLSLLLPAGTTLAQSSSQSADEPLPKVRMVTSEGALELQLRPDVAPATVANFLEYARAGFFDGTIFHRVIPKFMIQGGDPMGTGRGGPGYRFEDETTPDVVFDAPGLLAMANAGPNTNGSQFFITDRSTPSHLNGKHTIFGQCENLDVVEAIATTERAGRDKPKVDVVLKRVEIVR